MVVARDVDRVLRRAVDAGVVPGVVALAADDEGVRYAGAFGTRGFGTAVNMILDMVMGSPP